MTDHPPVPLAVDLDPLPVVWERWSVLAAVDAAATKGQSDNPHDARGGEFYYPDLGGVAWYDHGGTWAHLVPCGRGRGVLFGWDHDYTPPDHRAGLQVPPWVTSVLDDPRFWDDQHDHRHRDGGFYAYWYDGVTWYYEPPNEDDPEVGRFGHPEVGLFSHVFSEEDTIGGLAELIYDMLEYEPADDTEEAEIGDVLGRLVANAHARQADHAAFAALFDRADVDVAPAVAVAQRLGIAPGSIDPLA